MRPASSFVSLLAIAGVFAIGCSSVRVSTDYDPSAPFSSFKRYAWLPPQPGQNPDPRLQNDLIDARVRGAADRVLGQRGFQLVSKEEADFFVTYYLGLETRIDVQTVQTGWGYSRRGWSGGASTQTRVRQFEEGTLMIDLLEPSERRLVWRGTGQTRVSQSTDRERRNRQIDEAVEAILDRFPPKSN